MHLQLVVVPHSVLIVALLTVRQTAGHLFPGDLCIKLLNIIIRRVTGFIY